jgi:solute:Na+ symporter, SSS family
MTTIVGVLLSIGAAYLAQYYNNIMDLLQLVFGFVNAPLFATFLLGMFWKRATATARSSGWSPAPSPPRSPGVSRWPKARAAGSPTVHTIFPSQMAQNFWIAIVAFTSCFLITVLVSTVTTPRKERIWKGWSTA